MTGWESAPWTIQQVAAASQSPTAYPHIAAMGEGVCGAIPQNLAGRRHALMLARKANIVGTPVPHTEPGPYPPAFQPSSEIRT